MLVYQWCAAALVRVFRGWTVLVLVRVAEGVLEQRELGEVFVLEVLLELE